MQDISILQWDKEYKSKIYRTLVQKIYIAQTNMILFRNFFKIINKLIIELIIKSYNHN